MKLILKVIIFSIYAFSLFMPLTSNAHESLEKCVASRITGSFVDLNFNPHLMQTRTHSHVQMESSAQLFRRGHGGNIINELAKSTNIDLDNNIVRVKLDPSCHWSDGHPITASDVIAGIYKTIIIDPYNNTAIHVSKQDLNYSDTNQIPKNSGLRVVNDTTIEFDLQTSPQLLTQTLTQSTFTPIPLHLGQNWPGSSMVRVSSGPFVAVTHTDTRIEFERNPYYCNGLESNTRKIIHHGIEGKRTISRMMQSKIINIGEQLSTSELSDLQTSPDFEKNFSIWNRPPQVMSYLIFKPTSHIGKDPDLTDAIILAIDFEKIALLQGGSGVHGQHMQSLNFPFKGYEPLIVKGRLDLPYKERLEKARKILATKGYGPNNKLEINFALRHSAPYEQLGYMIRGMLNTVNINANTKVVNSLKERQTYDLSLNAAGKTVDHPNGLLSFFLTTLNSLGINTFEKYTKLLQMPIADEKYFQQIIQIEQQILDSKVFHPVYEVLSPTVLAKNIKPGKEFYFLGRNMIFDDCN